MSVVTGVSRVVGLLYHVWMNLVSFLGHVVSRLSCVVTLLPVKQKVRVTGVGDSTSLVK